MILNHVKLWRAVTFMKYFAGAVSLLFLPKTLPRNKMTFLVSNSLKLAELVVDELQETIFENIYHKFILIFNLSLINVKIVRAHN